MQTSGSDDDTFLLIDCLSMLKIDRSSDSFELDCNSDLRSRDFVCGSKRITRAASFGLQLEHLQAGMFIFLSRSISSR